MRKHCRDQRVDHVWGQCHLLRHTQTYIGQPGAPSIEAKGFWVDETTTYPAETTTYLVLETDQGESSAYVSVIAKNQDGDEYEIDLFFGGSMTRCEARAAVTPHQ